MGLRRFAGPDGGTDEAQTHTPVPVQTHSTLRATCPQTLHIRTVALAITLSLRQFAFLVCTLTRIHFIARIAHGRIRDGSGLRQGQGQCNHPRRGSHARRVCLGHAGAALLLIRLASGAAHGAVLRGLRMGCKATRPQCPCNTGRFHGQATHSALPASA